jgi:uncharacterized protein
VIVHGEEIFVVPYSRDETHSLVYVPLRSYTALVAAHKVADLDHAETLAPEWSHFISCLKLRPYIDIKQLHAFAKKRTRELSVAITDDCNLRCRYCHHSAGSPGRTATMSSEMLEAVLATFIASLPGHEGRISFFGGGEPTCALDKLKYAVEFALETAAEKGKSLTFKLATNGCFGKTAGEFLVRYFKEISLSFDGPPHIHNLHRPLKNGRASFPAVFANAKHLFDRNIPFAIRATVSDYSLSYMKELIDFFATEFPGRTVGLEPLNPYGRAKEDHVVESPAKEAFAEFIIDAYRYAEGKPIQIMSASVGKFDHLRTVFCGSVAVPNWTVATDGRISCCTRDNAPEAFEFGHFDCKQHQFVLDDSRLVAIGEMNVFSYPECNGCFCKYHCAGDCPDLRASALLNCTATRKMGEYWLNRRFDERRAHSGPQNEAK